MVFEILKLGWYKFYTTLYQPIFPKNLKLWHQKIGFGTGHEEIGLVFIKLGQIFLFRRSCNRETEHDK